MSSQVQREDGTDVFQTFHGDDAAATQRVAGALQAGARSAAVHRPGAYICIMGRGFVFQPSGNWRDSVTGEFVEDPYAHMERRRGEADDDRS